MAKLERTLEWMYWGIAGLAVGAAILRYKGRVVRGRGGHPYPLPKDHGVPFAAGPMRPVWPIQSSSNPRHLEVAYRDEAGNGHGNVWGRGFKARRASGKRWHSGIDIYADEGDVVVSPEDGVIVADQNFLNSIPGEDAMIIQGDSGTTILLGEIVAESMTTHFNLREGDRVKAGQPVAIVAKTVNGSHMLHFETYAEGVNRNRSWKTGNKAHPTLRDPTAYLLRARAQALGV
jgi:murein DD-endopeptidase MepM/ murein hydrolase activator NlpD